MPTVEERVEAPSITPNYSAIKFTEAEIAAGAHRRFIGGRWDSHGAHQLDFLVGRGLKPAHRLLDIGCGCFRAGRHFVDYLDPANYYGVDASQPVIQAGYDVELTDEQRDRLPVTNLRANDRFDADFGVEFDFALAQSVFSHVSLNHIQLCLYRLGRVMRPGGSFFATFFERGEETPLDAIFAADKPKPFYHEKNAYWYRKSDLRWASRSGPWKFVYIGDWGHPSGQKMVEFVRLTDSQLADRDTRQKARRPSSPAGAQQQTSRQLMNIVQEVGRAGRQWVSQRRGAS